MCSSDLAPCQEVLGCELGETRREGDLDPGVGVEAWAVRSSHANLLDCLGVGTQQQSSLLSLVRHWPKRGVQAIEVGDSAEEIKSGRVDEAGASRGQGRPRRGAGDEKVVLADVDAGDEGFVV